MMLAGTEDYTADQASTKCSSIFLRPFFCFHRFNVPYHFDSTFKFRGIGINISLTMEYVP
jgi:hypothetical protein